jgi:hypothetical protein
MLDAGCWILASWPLASLSGNASGMNDLVPVKVYHNLTQFEKNCSFSCQVLSETF